MTTSREAFEAAYSSGDTICDAMSLTRRDDGEYEQALARLCCKWFVKGQQACDAQWREKVQSEEMVGIVMQAVVKECDFTYNMSKSAAKAALAAIIKELGV